MGPKCSIATPLSSVIWLRSPGQLTCIFLLLASKSNHACWYLGAYRCLGNTLTSHFDKFSSVVTVSKRFSQVEFLFASNIGKLVGQISKCG